MPLNPNAKAFSFNPNASEFVPNFGGPPAAPKATSDPVHAGTNGIAEVHAPAKSVEKDADKEKLHTDAPEFVPGGAKVAESAPDKAEAHNAPKNEADHPHQHHHDNQDKDHKELPKDNKMDTPSASGPSKSWASLAAKKPEGGEVPPVADIKPKESIKSPPSTSHVAPAPVPPLEAKKYQSKGPAPVVTAPRVKGEKYTLKAMLDLRTSASLLEGTQVCMQDLKRLLEETPELDPEKDMPSRQQGDAGGRGAPRTGTGPGAIGAGTPRKGGRLGKNDVPLRDKNGKIIEVKALELSEGRWKPGRATDDEEKVYKAAKGIMNKLTLEKFDKLYGELLNVGITNASLLRGFVVLIYDKAVLEPTFINMYARMCQRLAQDLPEFSDEEGVLPFGDVLVGKCRSEFASMGDDHEKELEGLAQDERENKLRKIRQRTLGNVEFIGELFKVNMVGSEDVLMSLDKLVTEMKTDQEKIQFMCKMLEGVGPKLEENDKAAVDGFFAVFDEMVAEGSLNSRFKFMLMDLKELRSKGWKARREVAGPKLLEEIQKEVDKENRFTEKKKVDKEAEKAKAKKKEGTKRAVKELKVEDDGWSQVTTVVKGRVPSRGGRNTKEEQPSSPLAAAKAGKKEGAKGISMVRGGFAALMDDDEDGSGSGDDESEEESEEEEEEEEEEAEVPAKHGPELDAEAVSKVGFILEEFMCIHDVEEAVQCMVELHETAKYSKAVLDEEVVRRGLCMALDQSPKECTLMSKMYARLIERDILRPEDASAGFCNLFLDLADISIDIPKAPELLASIARDMLLDGHLSKDIMAKGIKELQQGNASIGKHFDEVLTIVSQ